MLWLNRRSASKPASTARRVAATNSSVEPGFTRMWTTVTCIEDLPVGRSAPLRAAQREDDSPREDRLGAPPPPTLAACVALLEQGEDYFRYLLPVSRVRSRPRR